MFQFPKMLQVFKDPQMQANFERDGFVVVDLYSPEQISEIEQLYHKLHPVDEKGFFPSTFSANKNYRETTDAELKRISKNRFDELLQDYQVINGSFIVKSPGEDSYLHIHQDMTLVDESKYTGHNVWTPLCDLNTENGVLYLLPGSHRFFPTYRGSTIRGFYEGLGEELKDYMVPYYLKAGQAIIFDQSIIHFSPPNLSDKVRIVTNVYFTHKDASFMVCYHDRDNPEWKNKVELFEQDVSFMTSYEQFFANMYSRPNIGKSLGLFDYDFPELSKEELENKFGVKKVNLAPKKKGERADYSTLPGAINVPPIFKDPALQSKFDKQGFVTLPFLNEEEVKHMDKLFDELHPDLLTTGFFAGSYSPDFAYKKRVSEEIKVVYKRRYEEVFQNYESFGGAYLCKMPTEDSQLYVHQDWTVVDESKTVALNIWIPLCDITLENGPLMVVPGSHYNAYPVLRSPTMPQFFDDDLVAAMEELEPVIVKAGEAVILNQSIVHYSPPNRSNKIRKAITAGVKTKGTQMIFHYKEAGRTDKLVEKFEMDDDFFIQFDDFFKDIFKRPYVGKSIGMIAYEVPVLRGEELRAMIRKMKTDAGFALKQKPKTAEPVAKTEAVSETAWVDNRPFFEKYTPLNIVREIKKRILA